MAALINTIQINYYKQQCQRTQRTNHVCAYSEVRSVVSQPKCNLIQVFSWILDDGRAPTTGIRRVNLEPTDGNISPVSVRSALFKVAGYPGNFSRRAGGGRPPQPSVSLAGPRQSRLWPPRSPPRARVAATPPCAAQWAGGAARHGRQPAGPPCRRVRMDGPARRDSPPPRSTRPRRWRGAGASL